MSIRFWHAEGKKSLRHEGDLATKGWPADQPCSRWMRVIHGERIDRLARVPRKPQTDGGVELQLPENLA
jgi:hypothetical protein